MKQDFITQKAALNDNSVLVRKFIAGINGGRTLDVSDFEGDILPAGLFVMTDGEGVYKPIPLADETSGEGEEAAPTGNKVYDACPEGFAPIGILIDDHLKTKNGVAIMTWGIVNEAVLPYPATEDIKKALPHIDFQKDEEA